MTKRDRAPSDTETGTQPGKGAVREAAVDGFGAALPKYVFDRPQSDEADAAHYQAAAHVPAKPTGVAPAGAAKVEIVATPPREQDTVDRAMAAALKAPSNTDLGEEHAELRRIRGGLLDGVSTDPRAEERRRHTTVLALAALAVIAGLVAVGVAYKKLASLPVPATASAISTASAPVSITQTTAPPTTSPSVAPSPTRLVPPPLTTTATAPVATTARTTPSAPATSAPAPTGSVDPLTHVLDQH